MSLCLTFGAAVPACAAAAQPARHSRSQTLPPTHRSVANAIYGYINSKLPAGITIADASKADAAGKAIDDYFVQIVDSFSIDKNFPSDNIFIVRG